MNILVADDDPGCINLLQELLEMIPDVSVITAYDGAEVWWWITHPDLKYALAIIDVKNAQGRRFCPALAHSCYTQSALHPRDHVHRRTAA